MELKFWGSEADLELTWYIGIVVSSWPGIQSWSPQWTDARQQQTLGKPPKLQVAIRWFKNHDDNIKITNLLSELKLPLKNYKVCLKKLSEKD